MLGHYIMHNKGLAIAGLSRHLKQMIAGKEVNIETLEILDVPDPKYWDALEKVTKVLRSLSITKFTVTKSI
jgi:hypothetical protein